MRTRQRSELHHLMRRARPGADVAALDAELDAMRRDLDLLQQYATQDAVHVDGATVAARCACCPGRWSGRFARALCDRRMQLLFRSVSSVKKA